MFQELGFEEVWESGGYAGFRNGNAEFILQDFANEAFASNLMILIRVRDLDRWWEIVSRNGSRKPTPHSG